tara:strand:- start:532 stop:1221 length:690 start_codon:yes stop_codon:yes gene_type:complete
MSKSKKNTIDPENIISNYGADAARLFILSDSPPEKDVQWSEEGIASSYKFIQKLWNLNSKILYEIKQDHKAEVVDEITKYTNKYLKKVTDNLEEFNYNKIIANLHEVYSFLIKELNKNYRKEIILENYEKILLTMLPIVPHFANECLELMNSKKNYWPNYNETLIKDDIITIVIQINGKKRGLINTKPNISEESLLEIINKDKKLTKFLEKKIIKRKIFIKDKLINIII